MPPPPGGDAHDLLLCCTLARELSEGSDCVGAGVHREDTEEVFRLKRVHREDRALVGERHLGLPLHLGGHGTGAIENDEQRYAGRILPVLVLHAHRQQLLNRCAVVAADSVAVFAAEHHEATAEILDPSAVELHLLPPEPQRGNIAQHEKVELLEVFERFRESVCSARLYSDFLRPERLGQWPDLPFVGVHEQHSRLSAQAGGGGGAVILYGSIRFGSDLDFVGNEAAFGLESRSPKFVHPRFERHVALLNEKAVLVELYDGRRRRGAADLGRKVERFTELEPARNGDTFHENLRTGAVAERCGPELHAAFGELPGRGESAIARIVAIAEENDSPRTLRGKDCRGILESAVNIGGALRCGLGPLLREARRLRGGSPEFRGFGETSDGDEIRCSLVLEALVDELLCLFTRGGGDTRRRVHEEKYGEPLRWQERPRASKGERKQEEQDGPGCKADPALPGRHVCQGSACTEHEHQARTGQYRKEPPRMRDFYAAHSVLLR